MGYEYEVYVWNGREYLLYWQGETWPEAVAQMNKAASEGFKCIKFEWRPGGSLPLEIHSSKILTWITIKQFELLTAIRDQAAALMETACGSYNEKRTTVNRKIFNELRSTVIKSKEQYNA